MFFVTLCHLHAVEYQTSCKSKLFRYCMFYMLTIIKPCDKLNDKESKNDRVVWTKMFLAHCVLFNCSTRLRTVIWSVPSFGHHTRATCGNK